MILSCSLLLPFQFPRSPLLSVPESLPGVSVSPCDTPWHILFLQASIMAPPRFISIFRQPLRKTVDLEDRSP